MSGKQSNQPRGRGSRGARDVGAGCEALPDTSCFTTPTYSQCHSVSTYNHNASNYIPQFPVGHTETTTAYQSTNCNSLGFKHVLERAAGEFSYLKVCGSACVECTLCVNGVLQVCTLECTQTSGTLTTICTVPVCQIPVVEAILSRSTVAVLPAGVAAAIGFQAPTPIPFNTEYINTGVLTSSPNPGCFTLLGPATYELKYNLDLNANTLNSDFLSIVLENTTASTSAVVDSRNFAVGSVNWPIIAAALSTTTGSTVPVYGMSGSAIVPVTGASATFCLRLDNNNTGTIGLVNSQLALTVLSQEIAAV